MGRVMKGSQFVREGSVRARRIWSVAVAATVVATLAGCAAAKPRTYGAYNDLTPKVTAQQGERAPQHVTVELSRPANVAVFLVVPGGVTRLLFPADSMASAHMESGSHTVETAMARVTLTDSSRLMRRPGGQPQGPTGTRPTNSRNGRLDQSGLGLNARGYLLVYATADSLPYATLATRVAGISVPIDDSDALNTVTKLIHQVTKTTGTWAAFATEYP